MKENFLLIIGLSITGFTVGYMVGGSSTPVVGIAIPLLFGLIITSFGMFQPYKHIKHLHSDITNNIDEIISKTKKELSEVKRIIGFTLIFFSSFYLVGTFIGSYTRINSIFKVTNSPAFPWSKDNKPKEMKEALAWIKLQNILTKLGYSKSKIEDLYKIENNKLILEINKTELSNPKETGYYNTQENKGLLDKRKTPTSYINSGDMLNDLIINKQIDIGPIAEQQNEYPTTPNKRPF